MITFFTANSTYEIDPWSKRIRRVSGSGEATQMFGCEGAWRDYAYVTVLAGRNLMISWPGTTVATITSTIEDPSTLAELRLVA